MSCQRVVVLALFSAGYLVSFLFRGLNLGIAPSLGAELGISAADMGLLSSLYFLGFALALLPVGILLDRFGPRRVEAGMLLLAAAGAAVFSQATGLAGLMAGRFLIGVGVAACLSAAFKAMALWFPLARLPAVNGLVMAIGGMGGVLTGAPLTWLLQFAGWRSVVLALAGVSLLVSLLLWAGAPERGQPTAPRPLRAQLGEVARVLAAPMFWRLGALSIATQAVFYAMQSLWMGPFLASVRHLPPSDVANLVSLTGFAMMAGCVLSGSAAHWLFLRGISLYAFAGAAMSAFVGVQCLILLGVPLPDWLLWGAYGLTGCCGILSYALLPRHFPIELVGRVNAAMSMLLFLLIFLLQTLIGTWVAGRDAGEAHAGVWVVLIVLQLPLVLLYWRPGARRAGGI